MISRKETVKGEADLMPHYIEWMKEALDLAEKGRYTVGSNPMVGALVIDGFKIIGRGYHEQFGKAHAEVNAIAEALQEKEKLEGCILVVSLEPCCHIGKTPPCTELIMKHKIKKVIVAMRDPNPLVAGKGLKQLKEKGIEVVLGVLEASALKLNDLFVHRIKTALPFVTMKTAMTLDGKIATVTGDSKWISGDDSRKLVHHLRLGSDGIMVGIGTLLADDPLLTTRLETCELRGVPIKHPIPIIVDSKGRIPLDARVLNTPEHPLVIIATTDQMTAQKEAALQNKKCRVYRLGATDAVDLTQLMKRLGDDGISSILLEGGSTLNYSMLEEGLVQKVISFIAPKIIGGSSGLSPVGGKGIKQMSEALVLEEVTYQLSGEDMMIEGYISRPMHKGGRTCLQD